MSTEAEMVASPDMAEKSAVNGQLEFNVIISSTEEPPVSVYVVQRKFP